MFAASDRHNFDLYWSKSTQYFMVLNLIMIVALAASVITARKIVAIGPLTFPCCNIIFSLLTFPITDIISEVWGKQYAKISVYAAFSAQVLFVVLIEGSIRMPYPMTWGLQTTYQTVLGNGSRVLIASMTAFLISQMWDVIIYAKLKRICQGKYLWIRNNLSTMSSQAINSLLFISIAFYGQYPISTLFLGSIVLKCLIAIIDTPLVYLGVHWLHQQLDGKTLCFSPDE